MAVGLSKSKLDKSSSSSRAMNNQLSHELPLQSAKVTISYPGKLDELEILLPVNLSLRKISNKSLKDAHEILSNSFVWADNWFGLHALLASGQKAQLIYLDPPYATGMDFQSRSLEHAYTDTLSSASYLEYMRRRLILIRELLEDSGSVYVHIGHQMVAELKLIMDEVFGQKNFRNLITRRKCSSKNFTKNQYSNLNDYILFYTKSSNYIWNQPTTKPDAEWIAKEYSKIDEKGQYKLVPIHAPGTRRGETGTEWRGMMPPQGKHWQYTPAKLEEFDRNGEIHWSKTGNPRRKVYLLENKGIALTDYWDQFRDAHHQSVLITGYPTEKNFDMLKMIVAASSNEGDLVIDPFCGSGSTLHAARDLNRKWIGIDQSFLAVKTVISRLEGGRKPMGDFVLREALSGSELNSIPHEATSKDFEIYIDSRMYESFPDEVNSLLSRET